MTGNIDAEEARIGGLVEGTVAARNLVLESSARIKGDIVYQTISVAAGAQVDGRLARSEALALPEEPANRVLAAAIAETKPRKPDQAVVPDDIFSLSPPRQAAAG